MFYYLFEYLDKEFNMPGAGLFQYILFRGSMAIVVSLLISLVIGKSLINLLRKKQVGETIRDLGLDGQKEKTGTPTMGGLIIIAAIIIPVLLFAKLHNIYIIMMLITTVWLGIFGFIDDYIKTFKKNKKGMSAKFKILGQVVLGLVIGGIMYFSPDVVIRERAQTGSMVSTDSLLSAENNIHVPAPYSPVAEKSTKTTIPFVKNNEFDYSVLIDWMGEGAGKYVFIVFILVVCIIIFGVANGANLTDGIDGLATGTSAIVGVTLGVLAYVSGNMVYANYLNLMYIPDTGELSIFIGAFVGACVGFLWYNSHPAQVFMGDTGSLTIGGIIAVFAIIIRKELLIPLLCGIFVAESLSALMQVCYFKLTRKLYGEGRRIFRMTPLHHHYQKLGYKEQKITMRFFIVAIILAILTIVVTLKVR
jgi:phospho-N-acetylmuramoyl-pentapeptide-transferase